MSNFKTFSIPTNHLKFLLKSFNISVYITDLDMLLASNDETTCQIDWLYFSLLNKLHISIKSFAKRLINTTSHHFWVNQVVKWRYAALQEMHLRKGNHIHCDFIQIYIQITFKSHTASEVIHHVSYNAVFFLKVSFSFFLVTCL